MEWIKITVNSTMGNFTKGTEMLILLQWGTPVVARLVGTRWFTGFVYHDFSVATHYARITPPTND